MAENNNEKKNKNENIEAIKASIKKAGDKAVKTAKTVVSTGIGVIEEGQKFYKEHKSACDLIMVALFGTTAIRIGSGKGLLNDLNNDPRNNRDCRFWDPRTGRYSYSRRPLDWRETEELDRRYRNGESYSSILHDMRLDY